MDWAEVAQKLGFTVDRPWAGDKDEMPNFLAWIPKYLSKNSDTKACSDILTKVYEEGIDLFEKMPSLDETAGVAAIPARGGNNPRPAIPAKPPTGTECLVQHIRV